MRKFLTFFVITFLVTACAATKTVYVPTDAETIIEYRDTTIRVVDTIKVEVPREVIKEVMPIIDTSRLETSIAYSEAFIDTLDKKLHHTLRNKETALKGKLDTIVRVQYVNKYIEKEVINEVEVEVPYIPKWCWIIMMYAALMAGITIMKIIGRFR